MTVDPDKPETWPGYKPTFIAHDVGRSKDRSTAVIGGPFPWHHELIGIGDLRELPLGLYGSARASALAAIDREYFNNSLIVADLSHDPTYGEVLYETFGRRVIGVHITRHGSGREFERRPVCGDVMWVYTIGRSFLLEQFHRDLTSRRFRMVENEMSHRAYQQLANLEVEHREAGTVYGCPPGQHDDLGISCAMLAWAATHPHLPSWVNILESSRPRPRARPVDPRTIWHGST